MITELKKRTADGRPYGREPDITARLRALAGLSKPEQMGLCRIDDRTQAGYVPSECLLYLVRAYRGLPVDDYLEELFKLLVGRVARALPQGNFARGTDTFSSEEIQERTVGRFVTLLIEDRETYSERLDYYEARFDDGIAKLKVSAQRELIRSERGKLSLDHEGFGQQLVEAKLVDVGPLSTLVVDLENPLFRIPLETAIDKLPIVQQRIIHMLLKGFQIDSKDINEITISRTLRKSERTIRNLRDRAVETLSAELRDGERQ